jgi:hypothetical protein
MIDPKAAEIVQLTVSAADDVRGEVTPQYTPDYISLAVQVVSIPA